MTKKLLKALITGASAIILTALSTLPANAAAAKCYTNGTGAETTCPTGYNLSDGLCYTLVPKIQPQPTACPLNSSGTVTACDPTTNTGCIKAENPEYNCVAADKVAAKNGDCVRNYINLFSKILAGAVGLVVTAMIIIAGIQYSASGGDPKAVEAAKKRIFNAVLALIAFIFMGALLQYLIPGGLF